jgi:hypothetical protein
VGVAINLLTVILLIVVANAAIYFWIWRIEKSELFGGDDRKKIWFLFTFPAFIIVAIWAWFFK